MSAAGEGGGDIKAVDVRCETRTDSDGFASAYPTVIATTRSGEVEVWGTADGPLPVDFASPKSIQALYSLFAQHGIPVTRHPSPDCEHAATANPNPDAHQQYAALFSG